MKILLLICLSLSFSAFSMDNFKARVNQGHCGELDSYYVGEICLMHITRASDKKKFVLVFDYEYFLLTYKQENAFRGKNIMVFGDLVSNITDYDTLRLLREYDDSPYYLEAKVEAISPLNSIKTKMDIFLKKINNRFYSSRLPEGYTAVKLNKFEINENLKKFLTKTTNEKKVLWKEYVLGYYTDADITMAEMNNIINNPWAKLEVKYLLTLTTQYNIYKDGKFIGQYIEMDDHVQAAIYEDGAWIEVFTDTKGNIIFLSNEAA